MIDETEAKILCGDNVQPEALSQSKGRGPKGDKGIAALKTRSSRSLLPRASGWLIKIKRANDQMLKKESLKMTIDEQHAAAVPWGSVGGLACTLYLATDAAC